MSVEDEEHLANGLKFNLEAEGYAVDVEENGEAALYRLTQGSNGIDLVLLDVMLPGLDGFEVVRRRARSRKLRPGCDADGERTHRRRAARL